MAVSVLRALLVAQARGAWNRMRHESGLGGPLLAVVVLGVVDLIVAGPCLLTLRLGLELGEELKASADAGSLLRWTAFQALFTVLFAFFGGFRHRPTFTFRELGRFPVQPFQLLLAEVPVSLFEVFPILGAAGIVASNLGLAFRMPAASPLIAILAVQGIVAMTALLFLFGSAKRFLFKRRTWAVSIGAGVLGAGLLLGWEGIRTLLRSGIPEIIPYLPGSQGYAGVLDLTSGRIALGSARVAASIVLTAALLALAAWVHQREMAVERSTSGSRRSSSPLFRFRRPAFGIARLFQKQLLDSHAGRFFLVTPVALTGPYALLIWVVRWDAEQLRFLPPEMQELVTGRATDIPLLVILLCLIVFLDSQVWMNQFGWDRTGIRTLLLLPISARDLVLGKLLGILRLMALQALLGVLPLLWIHLPSISEVLVAAGSAGTSFFVAVGIGHFLSARFPRAVVRDGSANTPLYLSWIPTLLILMLAVGLAAVHGMAEKWGTWAPPATLLALAAATATAYVLVLPILARQVRLQRERLLQM